MQVLKLRVCNVECEPFAPNEKLRVLSSLLIGGCCVTGGVYGKIVSEPPLPASCGFLLVCLMCSRHSASLSVFLKRKFSICSWRLNVSMGGDEFKSFLHQDLELFSPSIFYYTHFINETLA